MLRGVNRRIIEVNDTGSDYFEKALFFVKGDAELNADSLEREAKRIMVSYFNNDEGGRSPGYLRYTDTRRKKRNAAIILSLAIVLGIAALSLLVSLIY